MREGLSCHSEPELLHPFLIICRKGLFRPKDPNHKHNSHSELHLPENYTKWTFMIQCKTRTSEEFFSLSKKLPALWKITWELSTDSLAGKKKIKQECNENAFKLI